MGHGRPFVTTLGTVPERGKSEQSEDPDVGGCFFCLLCFAQAKKSEAPSGAQQKLSNNHDNPAGTKQEKQRIAIPLPSSSTQQPTNKNPVAATGFLGSLPESYA
jgi:hypothetical protein